MDECLAGPDPGITNIDFGCTLCGQCCHDLKLPLTVAEAIAWLGDGQMVQVLCEASPWSGEPAAEDLPAAHRRRRSFAALSGQLKIRVVAILAASFTGPCPNLRDDLRCGIYARRPLVCGIYPAEINPFLSLRPDTKACPPTAWATGTRPLIRLGRLVDAPTLALIDRSRQADADDVPAKARLCATLNLTATALATDGFVVHSPAPGELLAALRSAADSTEQAPPACTWHFVSNRHSVREELQGAGALVASADRATGQEFDFIGLASEVDA